MTKYLSANDVEGMLGMKASEAIEYLEEIGVRKAFLERSDLDTMIGLTVVEAIEYLSLKEEE